MKLKVLMAELYPLISEKLKNEGKVTFTVSGQSMQPMLYDKRDMVTLVPPPEKLKKYDLPFFCLDDGKFILHRVIKVHKDGTYECRGDNRWESEDNVRHDQIIGVVKSFTRNGRKISVDKSFGYFLYVHTWGVLHYFKKYYHYFTDFKKSLSNLRERFKNLMHPKKINVLLKDGTMKSIIYRKACKKDLEVLQKLSLEHLDFEKKTFDHDVLSRAWPLSEDAKKYFLTLIENQFVYVALSNKQIIGYIMGVVAEKNSDNFPIGECRSIFVSRDYRRLGIATELLNAFKEYCKTKNCDRIKVAFLNDNQSAEKLYANHGFKPYTKTVMLSLE